MTLFFKLGRALKPESNAKLRLHWRTTWKSFSSSTSSSPVRQTTAKMTSKADCTPYLGIRLPNTVHGMTKLDRNAFKTSIEVPYLTANVSDLDTKLKKLKPFLIKLIKFNAIRDTDDPKVKEIILNPDSIHDERFKSENGKDLQFQEVSIGYENLKAVDILNAVLPSDADGSSSHSRIGHIIHLNLRDHLAEYRFLIGQVLIDKSSGVTLVVNKAKIIESTFRNFQLEVLAGDGPTVTTVKENGCIFTFDFAQVYWNPRLCTEHTRIVEMFESYDVLFDVFAGVGPFSVPAGKKKSIVFANDLNPHSYEYLKSNVKKNKVEDKVSTFNLDGREFIQTVLKPNLLRIWNELNQNLLITTPKIEIVMNLPALAVEFLDVFKGLLRDNCEFLKGAVIYPKVHVYTFTKGENPEVIARQNVRNVLNLSEEFVLEYSYVRAVAPMKDMVRISFFLNQEILFGAKKREVEDSEISSESKRICLELE